LEKLSIVGKRLNLPKKAENIIMADGHDHQNQQVANEMEKPGGKGKKKEKKRPEKAVSRKLKRKREKERRKKQRQIG
jgi:hypothetical protein